MKKDPTTEASIEAYETKLTIAMDGFMAAITAHDATKCALEEPEKRYTAEVARKKRETVATKKSANEEKRAVKRGAKRGRGGKD